MRRRRLVCASLVMLPVAGSASAQPRAIPRFGVTIGVNSATASEGAGDPLSRKTGFVAGVTTVFPLGPHFAVQSEMLYTEKGVKSSGSDGVSTLRINYFEIPVLLRADVASTGRARPFLYGGPALSLRASCEFEFEPSGARSSDAFNCDQFDTGEQGFKTVDYGLVIGGGFAFDVSGKTLTVGARYDHGLAKFVQEGDAKHRVTSVLGTLEFPWK